MLVILFVANQDWVGYCVVVSCQLVQLEKALIHWNVFACLINSFRIRKS